ncbi:MAG TPA: Gfo/Idh/MocA family oxidoreductase [Candidatus Brocadiia bacterium]|nr:Gfo/Idh/MocA family oxidoreductase [Candidatus Brocadiia bacterium]
MKQLSRREFLRKTGGAALGLGLASSFSAKSYAQIAGANEDIRVAVVGCGGKGADHVNRFSGKKGVRLVKICDADASHINSRLIIARLKSPTCEGEQDVRKILDDKGIDAIVTATPNHWHSLMVVWSCQAGKDIYVEKPATHNIWEGRKIQEAAAKYNRIVQCGMQQRSNPCWTPAFQWAKEGNLGKILYSRGLCYKRRGSIGKVDGPQQVPATVNYDLWCGPRETEPLMRKNLHYDWHWVWPTGNGDIGNQGVHQMDVAAWAIGATELPPGVISVGGRFGYVDDGTTPNTQFVVLDYKPVPIIFEVRGLADNKETNADAHFKDTPYRVGNILHCEGGYVVEGSAFDNDKKRIKTFSSDGGEGHDDNFIKAVRSRKMSDLNAPPLTGHISAACCHMGNISYRVGQQASPDEIRESVKYDSGGLETFERFVEHLSKNGVDIGKEKAILGPHLKFDPKTERFAGNGALDEKANAFLKDSYREPFVIPEKV